MHMLPDELRDVIDLPFVRNNPVTFADPLQKDCPLIYVNDAFTELTGYQNEDALGRNCRFLQGPKTDTTAVRSLRDDLDHYQAGISCVLNYRKDGSTFHNMLFVEPLHLCGEKRVLMGVQCCFESSINFENVSTNVVRLNSVRLRMTVAEQGKNNVSLDILHMRARNAFRMAQEYLLLH